MKYFKVLVKYGFWTGFALFVVAALFVGSLFFREQRLPDFLTERIGSLLSADGMMVRIDSASFGFRHGLRLQGVKVYDLERKNSLERPVGSARLVLFDYFHRNLDVYDAEYRRLPDSYYDPEAPHTPVRRIYYCPPEEPEWRVTLTRPVVLGLSPDRVQARVRSTEGRILLDDFSLDMPDKDRSLRVSGRAEADFISKKVRVSLAGTAKHSQIIPVLEAFDVPSAIPFVAACTEVNGPVGAESDIEVDMETSEIDLRIGFRPPRFRYRGVQVARSEATIGVKTENTGTNFLYRFSFDMPQAEDADGKSVAGVIAVDNACGIPRISYDCRSAIAFDELVDVTDFFEDDWFSFLECDTAPSVTVKGRSATSAGDIEGNDLSGTFSLLHGAVSGFRVNNVETEYALKGDILTLETTAKGKDGGSVRWNDTISFNSYSGKASFVSKAVYRNGSLKELSDFFGMDMGDKRGDVEMDLDISGEYGTNLCKTLDGRGRIRISDGYLAQMKFFAGLTKWMADNVPGISTLTDQSQASAHFTIEDGIVKSDDVYVEGGFISIKAEGTYDIAADRLDAIVRARFFKEESIVGKIIHPLTMPFTKMLFEFSVKGPLDDPEWKRIWIKDRIF